MRLVANSLHDEVATQLRERIFAGELSPGMFLDEVQLAEQMKISRTPLREALKVLTAEGLVRHEPRRGCFFNEVTEQDPDELRSRQHAAHTASLQETVDLDGAFGAAHDEPIFHRPRVPRQQQPSGPVLALHERVPLVEKQIGITAARPVVDLGL